MHDNNKNNEQNFGKHDCNAVTISLNDVVRLIIVNKRIIFIDRNICSFCNPHDMNVTKKSITNQESLKHALIPYDNNFIIISIVKNAKNDVSI